MIWRAGGAITLLAAALLYARLHVPHPAADMSAAPRPVDSASGLPAASSSVAPASPAGATNTDWPLAEPLRTPVSDPIASLDNHAIASLRATRGGDPRAPEIGEAEPYARADAHTRADPDRYQAWQKSRREANYADYLRASQARLVEIDAHLAWGQQNGVSDEQLRAGREKRDRLAKVRKQLAEDYPHLAEQVASESAPAGQSAAN